jgi:hypothetical protein
MIDQKKICKAGSLVKITKGGPVGTVVREHAYFCMDTGNISRRILVMRDNEMIWTVPTRLHQIVQY